MIIPTGFYEICITPPSQWSMRNPKTLGSNSKGFQDKAQGSFSKTKFEKQTLYKGLQDKAQGSFSKTKFEKQTL